MKKRVEEMEAEANKLRELHAERCAVKQCLRSGDGKSESTSVREPPRVRLADTIRKGLRGGEDLRISDSLDIGRYSGIID